MTLQDGEMIVETTNEIDMSNQVATIDPSVVQSRISMSTSLAKENDESEQPVFPKLSAMEAGGGRVEYRRVRCPPHRYTPLRENWEQILMPLVEYLKLQVSTACKWCTCVLKEHVMKVAKFLSTQSCSWSRRKMYKPTKKPRCVKESNARHWSLSDACQRQWVLVECSDIAILMSSLSLLQVRFNTKTRSVEMKTSAHTIDTGALQKGADFVSAFMLGFEVQDAVALLRLDDLYLESFQVTDVKLLRGDHLSRAIGRVAGQDGKTRFAIENATRTRIVIADTRIHMLGSYANIRVARNAMCDLILGAPPGKVYNNMRNVAKRMNERY